MLDLVLATWAAARVGAADKRLTALRREHDVELFFGEISIEVMNIDPCSSPSAFACTPLPPISVNAFLLTDAVADACYGPERSSCEPREAAGSIRDQWPSQHVQISDGLNVRASTRSCRGGTEPRNLQPYILDGKVLDNRDDLRTPFLVSVLQGGHDPRPTKDRPPSRQGGWGPALHQRRV